MSEQGKSSVRSVVRALTLLSRLTVDGSSLTDLSHRCDIPLPTALRLMRTLENENFARRQEDGTFVVGPSAVSLSYNTDPTGPFRWMIRQVLTELTEQTGETTACFVLSDLDAVCVETVDGIRPIRWVIRRGTHSKAYVSVPGRLLMAFSGSEKPFAALPVADGRIILRRGETRTIPEFEAELAKIRLTGVATSDFYGRPDSFGFALPIPSAELCAGAIVLSGPRERTDARRSELIETAKQVLEQASSSMPFGAPKLGATDLTAAEEVP